MSTANQNRVRDWPLWHFAQLEAAIEQGDYAAAALAQQELERLGVTVQYRGRRPETIEAHLRRERGGA
jgi:hypothetical protein